jgi:hypothetical protein
VRKLLPAALVIAVISIRCAGSPAEPIGTVSLTQTTTTTTTSVIPAINAGAIAMAPAGTGIAGATLYSFSVQPSGGVPPYTVQWNFGDGSAGAGNPATHIFAAPGTFNVMATVADTRAGATPGEARAAVNVRTVTGTWFITFTRATGDLPARESIDLVQNGPAITATINDTTNTGFGLASGTGTVSNPRTLSVNVTFGAAQVPPAAAPTPFAAALIGTLDSTATTWTGNASGYPGCPCEFTALRNNVPGVLSVPGAKR